MSRGKVLVVDDDPVVLEVVRERLEGAGWSVVVREQAIGTSESIFQHKPDFVLLDVMMPGLSGDRLATILKGRALTSKVEVILHTSRREGLEELVKKSQAIGAIQKTSDEKRFLAEFERLVSRARGRISSV